MFSPGLLVVHDAIGGGENDVSELTRGEELDNPLLHVPKLNIVARADAATLVETAIQRYDDLPVAI